MQRFPEKQKYNLPMEMFTKVNGSIIRQKDSEYTTIIRALYIKATGQKICKMVSVSKYGSITANIRVLTSMVENTARVNIHGLMEVIIKGHGKIIKFKATASTYGTTEGVTKVIGLIIKCMDVVSTNGKMVENMTETISLIKRKVQGNIIGLMENALKAYGSTESDKV